MAEYGVTLGVLTLGVLTAFTLFSGAVIAAIQRVIDLVLRFG
jgi:ABC-type bacteriocin/lantibiotic exporter with double-glycine peptidase domain